ncbi:MAG TPA: SDR family oxidoreductase [Candidatus Binatia bacterium]|jgi:dTDP-4-dehydrorhamnose reductase
MSQQRNLVIGASGLVGRSLMRILGVSGIGTYASHPRPQLRHLDIADGAEVRACLAEVKPQIIYLAAALTHVDYCEDHPDEAFRQNAEGARHVAAEAARHRSKVVYFSTEYVFDGDNGPYGEEDQTRPLSIYGKSKLEGEQAVAEACPDALAVRTTVVYGWDADSANFAMQIYRRVRSGAEMTVPDDQIGNPTLAEYLAETAVELAERGASGIINVVGNDRIPRSDFARALVRLYGGNLARVIPVSTASLGQKAVRPLNAGLRTDKLENLLGKKAIALDQALARLEREWHAAPLE